MPVPSDYLTKLVSFSREHRFFSLIVSGWIGHCCTATSLKAKFRQMASTFDAFCMMLLRCRASYRRLASIDKSNGERTCNQGRPWFASGNRHRG